MHKPFEAKKFDISALTDISAKTMEEHLGLYAGYVKNFNDMNALMKSLMGQEGATPAIAELARRLSFEFGGMRLHEHYFAQFEGGTTPLDPNGALAKAINESWPSENARERLVKLMKNYGGMRGPGWAILYWDPVSKQLMAGFSGEQHQGHFVTLPIVMAIDVWEHAYLLDQGASGKGKYLDAFFANVNWQKIEENFASAMRA